MYLNTLIQQYVFIQFKNGKSIFGGLLGGVVLVEMKDSININLEYSNISNQCDISGHSSAVLWICHFVKDSFEEFR